MGPTSPSPRQAHNILGREGRDLLWIFPMLFCSFPSRYRDREQKRLCTTCSMCTSFRQSLNFSYSQMSNRNISNLLRKVITLSQIKLLLTFPLSSSAVLAESQQVLYIICWLNHIFMSPVTKRKEIKDFCFLTSWSFSPNPSNFHNFGLMMVFYCTGIRPTQLSSGKSCPFTSNHGSVK